MVVKPATWNISFGALAQLVERLLCKQDVNGSNPLGSTILPLIEVEDFLARKEQEFAT
jgi:hypothetical protein